MTRHFGCCPGGRVYDAQIGVHTGIRGFWCARCLALTIGESWLRLTHKEWVASAERLQEKITRENTSTTTALR
ncbi:hypothetical protein E2C01_070338 [Portunus trituberculatus]|uniref:Uncharacterized protein n=1 Tax=Portunus trituberculatus TaxID=210409 RepID=A0A5B7I4Z6_PORTR|nr:hypothetical protein [Portunus trituberculatus]